VADVEVAVRLGREARDDRLVPALAQVGGDDLADEVAAFGRRGSVDRYGSGSWLIVRKGRGGAECGIAAGQLEAGPENRGFEPSGGLS
jgi:hypothetical protein